MTFTPAQRVRLEAIFAGGVCDWSRPGVGQQPVSGTWQELGPDREPRRRKRRVRISIEGSGGARRTVEAALRPCPETSWQKVVFESRSRRGPWRRFDAGYVSGPRCRSSARVTLRRTERDRVVRIRARAGSVSGYGPARSKAKRP